MTPHVPEPYRYLMKRLALARRYRGPGGAEMVTIVMHAKSADEIHAALVADLLGSSTPTPTTCATCNGEGVIFDLICDNCGGSASLPFGMTCPNHLAKPTPCPTCAANELTAEAQRLGLYEGDAT